MQLIGWFKEEQSPRNATIIFKSGFILLNMAAARVAFIFDSVASQLVKLAGKCRIYFVDAFLSASQFRYITPLDRPLNAFCLEN